MRIKKWYGNNGIFVSVYLGGEKVNLSCYLDSGSSDTSLDRVELYMIGKDISDFVPYGEPYSIKSATGHEAWVQRFLVPDVDIAGVHFKEYPIAFSLDPSVKLPNLIGLDFISSFNSIWDMEKRIITGDLIPNSFASQFVRNSNTLNLF